MNTPIHRTLVCVEICNEMCIFFSLGIGRGGGGSSSSTPKGLLYHPDKRTTAAAAASLSIEISSSRVFIIYFFVYFCMIRAYVDGFNTIFVDVLWKIVTFSGRAL